ncbi:carbamoyl phosphate synthase-like protein [Peptococcaceae bacterium CEB3]|nr:carbamoyl phosphate synthase-like protein [Peptococcaceae bacterium CEB3]
MIILEKPYVSDFLLQTVRNLGVPVLDNGTARMLGVPSRQLLDEKTFIQAFKRGTEFPLYTNSEDAIPWIHAHLGFSPLPGRLDVFKDKAKFRDLLKPLYPDFWYNVVSAEELPGLDINALSLPFVLKPVTGFLSLGVFKISSSGEWVEAIDEIDSLVKKVRRQYPAEVVNFREFLLERYVEGEEYAIDAYFNASGRPVILNILQHEFASAADVRDRLYYTSKGIIESNLTRFQHFLDRIGELTPLENLPLHIEVRVTPTGEIYPIEFNPMRFAGWCTTDIAADAYGINVYEYFWQNREPNWSECLGGKEGKIYSIVVGDVPKEQRQGKITGIDYEGFVARFSKVLALRKLDYREYGLFAFAFVETGENQRDELDWVQRTDYHEFMAGRPNQGL